MAGTLPEVQLSTSLDNVRRLVDTQFPQWTTLTLSPVDSIGTVNAVFRLGDELALRLPLVDGDPQTVVREARAAGELLGRTRFPTPAPVALGEPGFGYSMPWSVQTWVPGRTANEADPGESVAFAEDLAEFILGVRGIPIRGRTFEGPGRGGRLADSDPWMQECFAHSVQILDMDVLRGLWQSWRNLPRGSSPDVMSHRDLIPGNLLVSESGGLAGVLDVGGLGPADPALDLVAAWHVLDSEPRSVLRAALAVPDDEWERGKAWAFQQAMGLVWYYATSNPPMSHLGRRTLTRLTHDARL